MKFRVVAAMACAVVLCLAMAGCARLDTSKFLGTWELESTNIENLDAASLKLAKSLGSNMQLTLEEDGSGALYLFDELSAVTWEAETETQATASVDGQDGAISVDESGSSLSLEMADGRSLRFARG